MRRCYLCRYRPVIPADAHVSDAHAGEGQTVILFLPFFPLETINLLSLATLLANVRSNQST